MTLTELLKIGDEVVFRVNPETRSWTDTYDTVPDGTIGTVCGFGDAIIYEPRVPVCAQHQPGVYRRRGAVSVWLADGRIVPGDWCITMVDQAEQQRRNTALRDADGRLREKRVRLGDLPETKFWEQDKVQVRFPYDGRADGSPWPFYDIRYTKGGLTSVEESWMELVERGNVVWWESGSTPRARRVALLQPDDRHRYAEPRHQAAVRQSHLGPVQAV